MKYFTRAFRVMRINYILVRYNLDEFIYTTTWFSPFRFFRFFNPWYWALRNKLTRGQRIRCALEALGPIFIKAGQVLSTRRDILPDDIADELARLQDRVAPFSGKKAVSIVELALGLPLAEMFLQFDIEPLASASIAQVHAATLRDGKLVVVKVLRPGIKKIIDRDLDLLFTLANLAQRYSAESRRFKPIEIIAEIEHTLYDELDLMREGANASQLRRNFQGSTMLYVPEIYWPYSRSNVLVMERISGIPIHDLPALIDSGVNMKNLAERGIEVFFTQVFRDSFFHADMHPGNIFVSTDNLEFPQILAVDFGIVGSLSAKDQRYLAENMLAFFKRDYQRVAELHIASGWLPPDTRVDQFEGAIRAVCEPIFEKPLSQISFGQLLLRLFQAARRFNIIIQPQLILLQKTLLNIEGLGRQIYPDLDLWASAAPIVERWLKKQMGPRAFVQRVKDNLPLWADMLPEIPGLVFEVLNEQKQQLELARFANQRAEQDIKQRSTKSRQLWVGLGGGFLLSAVGLSLQQALSVPLLGVFSGIGIVCLLLAA
ncbi:MAG: ubiquinone biosynthesis regulatory protein kinase UbiB [Pseudomonadota bacterium]